jgi:hypothetical protein
MYTYLVLITTARLIMSGICGQRAYYIYSNALEDWLDHNSCYTCAHEIRRTVTEECI